MPKPKKKKPQDENQALTDKEYKFVMAYIKEPNGAKAARIAGYDPDKPQNSRFTARDLLTNTHIKKYIQDYKIELRKDVDIDQKEILKLCHEIMTANITDYINLDDYEVTKLTKHSPNLRAIASIKVTDKDGMRTEEIKLRDPIKAAEVAAKMLGLNEPEKTTDQNINVNITHVHKKDK